jgi:flagellar protein FliO/FliZ
MSGTAATSVAPAGGFPAGTGAFIMPWLVYCGSFVLVIALILLSQKVLKRLLPYVAARRQTRHLAVLESLALDQRRKLSLIRCGDKTGVILTGGGTDVFLGWTDDEPTSENTPEISTMVSHD